MIVLGVMQWSYVAMDATLIQSARRPKKTITIHKNGEVYEVDNNPVEYSDDSDAKWTFKAGKCLVPYNAHTGRLKIGYNITTNLNKENLWDKYYTRVPLRHMPSENKSKNIKEILIPLPKNSTLTGLPQRNGKIVIALKTSQWVMVEQTQV
jgi:hypothetical protein